MRISLFRLLTGALALVVIIAIWFLALHGFSSLNIHLNPFAPSPTALVLKQTDANHNFSISAGSTVQVQLYDQFPVPGSATIWSVTSSNSSVLSLVSEVVPSPLPAAGPALYSATFMASSPGVSVLNAHGATTCEAMLKTACPDQDFIITILVVAS
jgi:hypothetical protein